MIWINGKIASQLFINSILDEETYWQQRSRVQWFIQGDLNTRFFHVTASSRKRRNTIFSLEIDGSTCFDPVQLRSHVTAYYKSLLGSTTERDVSLNPNLWSDSERLTVSQSISLEAPFSLEEIRATLFSCNPNKAPGPDGLSFLFYQTFWDLIQGDIFHLFQVFFDNKLDLSKLNLASMCLIPKKADPKLITNYRPISLINCSFKLITKVLTDRLGRVIDSLINDSQTAFIKGRLITDNIACAHEVLHTIHKKKMKGVLFKLDYEKAFD